MDKIGNLLVNPDLSRTFAATGREDGLYGRKFPGFEGEPFQPYGWLLYASETGAGTVSVVQDDGKPALRVRVRKGQWVGLRQWVEVVPEAKYTCGVSIKGSGVVNLRPSAQTPAPGHYLDENQKATAAWAKMSKVFPVGVHRHFAEMNIRIYDEADVLLRGAEFSAEVPGAILPETVVASKPQKDETTLFYEDFDGPACAFDLNKSRLTEEGGGRFGKGLIVSQANGGAKAVLKDWELPESGTIEFWFKPTALADKLFVPGSGMLPLALKTKDQFHQFFFYSMHLGTFEYGFQKAQWDNSYKAYSQSLGNPGWIWWKQGTWHHLAGSWDKEALRVYVDGALEAYHIRDPKVHPHDAEPPKGIVSELVLPQDNVVIDEIRVSRGLKYGPLVPQGAVNTALLVAEPDAPTVAPTATGQYFQTSEKDLDAKRKELLSAVPQPKADYVLGVAKAKPGWEGMAGLTVMKDYFGKGIDGLEHACWPAEFVDWYSRPGVFYWPMEGVAPGKYYVGLWMETQGRGTRCEYDFSCLQTLAFLNGWPIRFSTTSDPVQVKPGLWLAELQTAVPIELRPGDELAFRPFDGTPKYLRLALYKNEPARGHGFTGQTFGTRNPVAFPLLHITPKAQILGPKEAGAPHEAHVEIANPLPYAVDAKVDWKLADYFGRQIAGKSQTVQIPPHGVKVVVSQAFTAEGDARGYQLDVKTAPAEGFKSPAPRPREMIELNDWGKLEFFPALLGPLHSWAHSRIDLKSDDQGDRRSINLYTEDGWERAPLVGRRVPAEVPAGLKYEGIRMPCYEIWPPNNAFGMWYRRKFKVPTWLRGQTFQIELAHAAREGTIFLNGHKLPGVCMGSTALRSDVTKLLKLDAENELVILIRGDIALVKEEFVDRNDFREGDTHYDYPRDDPDNDQRVLGAVYVRALPAVRVLQTLVIPDVEKNQLIVFSRVQNTRDVSVDVELRYTVEQEGKPVTGAAVPAAKATVKPGETREIKSVGAGKDLRPYTQDQPILCGIVTAVVEKGAAIDTERQRFGYRSMKIKGGGLSFNGLPITLLGGGPGMNHQVRMERECGMNVARMCWDGEDGTFGVPFFDETGILYYPVVSSSWPADKWELLKNDRYWQHDAQHGLDVIWKLANHPSCVGWNLSNECYHYAGYSVGGEGQDKMGQRFLEVAKNIREKVWPDFWFLSDGNERLGNRLEYTSWHYINQGWSSDYWDRAGFNLKALRGTQRDIAGYAPDCFFLNGAAEAPTADNQVRPGCVPDTWNYGMPCAATEEFWFTDMNNGPAVAKYVGDRAAVSSGWQFGTGRGMWWAKLSIEGYRDLGGSVLGTYTPTFLNTAMQAVTFSLPQQEIRYYGGATLRKRLTIFDCEYAPGELEFTWKLLDSRGEVRQTGSFKLRSTTSTLERRTIAFEVPSVTARAEFTLDMELRKNGRLREHEQRTLDVWPAQSASTKAKAPSDSVALFDPSGTVRSILERFGCKVTPIPALTPENLAGIRCLVIGPDSAREKMTAERDAVMAFASAGGRVLVLPQNEGTLLPVGTYFEKRLYASIGFVRTSQHPVMQSLADRDLAMWNPGHLIARGLYRTPTSGNFLPLVEAYHYDRQAGAIAWAPLLEIYAGEGSIVATQLPIIETLGSEPMAAELWRRLLAYMAAPTYRQLRGKLTVCDNVSEQVLSRLKELRVSFEVAGKASGSVTLLEMNQPDFSKRTDELRRYVQEGGTLLVHRARPEHQKWLADLTGRTVTVEIQPYASWVDRQMIENRTGLAEGLSNLDFYWRTNYPGESSEGWNQVSRGVDNGAGQVEYLVKIDGAAEHLFPGGWTELKVGNGRIIIDQVKWELPENPDKKTYGSPVRVAAGLMNNLGIRLKPLAPKPELPPNVRYDPLDISALANRGIRDDKAGDGMGWLDWGSGQDINDFVTGDVQLGLPYKVPKGDRNVIVLRTNPEWIKGLDKYPDTVTIPVGKKNVGGLWFLHSGAWANGPGTYASRIIRYVDGTSATLAMNSSNSADWNYGHDQFTGEEGTSTYVAWKGSCRVNPVTRVYHTLWINPYPQKEIKEVVLTNKDLPLKQCRFIAHFGVTAAILTDAPVVTGPQRDPKKSQALLEQALTLRQASKTSEATAMLEQSLQADDQNVAAWKTLTELRATSDSVDAFTAVCKRWFAAMPRNYQAHNVLGKFLESKNRPAEALAEYKKSLELEWNQPPTIQAKERLEKQLGGK